MRGRLVFALLMALAVVTASTSAFAGAPDAMTLSSWTPQIEDSAIVSGTQTVTMTNTGDSELAEASFTIVGAPCDCSITNASVSHGSLDGSVWTVSELASGETATMTIQYDRAVHAPTVAPTTPLMVLLIALVSAGWLLLLVGRRNVPRVFA
jgi:hypothetical protein